MIFSIDDIKKLLDRYFFSDSKLTSLEEIATNQKQIFTASLISFIEDNVETLKPHLPKLMGLFRMTFPQMKELDDATIIMSFIDYIIISEIELAHNASSIMKFFAADVSLSNSLKNFYIFRIIEKIRFAKLQRESLRDTSAYNRHIEKVLTEVKDALRVLFELDTSYDELEAILEKYYEFNRHVNIPSSWIEFFSLKGYDTFNQFIDAKKIDEKAHLDTDFE